ncbi:abortive infection family protein [Kineosporia rhizophila]|nr:abortive infection family protein [Kineosporia rhizophila]
MENSSRWTELALVTDTEDAIYETRLLRALRFGDDDYEACIYGVVPALLGHREVDPNDWPTVVGQPVDVYLDKLPLLEEHLDLPNWLAQYQPSLHRALYAHDLAEAASLEGVSAVAAELDLTEIARQLERLHRDLGDDLPAAIGHAKDLVESACKHILGEAGSGAGSRGPALVDAALRSVGRHPGQVDSSNPDAQLLKQLLGSVASQLHAVFGLRNRVGTGHGRSGEVRLDPALARLTIGTALNAVTYLLQVSDRQTTSSTEPPF